MILTELYQIDGKPMVAPDGNVQMSFEDIDSAQSGRDQAGYMHRIMVRRKVGGVGIYLQPSDPAGICLHDGVAA